MEIEIALLEWSSVPIRPSRKKQKKKTHDYILMEWLKIKSPMIKQ